MGRDGGIVPSIQQPFNVAVKCRVNVALARIGNRLRFFIGALDDPQPHPALDQLLKILVGPVEIRLQDDAGMVGIAIMDPAGEVERLLCVG